MKTLLTPERWLVPLRAEATTLRCGWGMAGTTFVGPAIPSHPLAVTAEGSCIGACALLVTGICWPFGQSIKTWCTSGSVRMIEKYGETRTIDFFVFILSSRMLLNFKLLGATGAGCGLSSRRRRVRAPDRSPSDSAALSRR